MIVAVLTVGALLMSCCACTSTKMEMFAYLKPQGGVRVVTEQGEREAQGTEAAQFFAWDRAGAGFVITYGGVLERVSVDGLKTPLLRGYRWIRFPDVRRGDGAIIVAATRSAPQETAWRMILVETGALPIDLGPGYDPCFTTDGKGVLFEDFAEDGTAIHHLDLESMGRRRLAEGHTPSVSPDGKHVYFSCGGKLQRLALSGEPAEVRHITAAGNYDRFASPSPDGKKLIFFRQEDGAETVVELTLATGAEHVLIRGQASFPTFRP